MSVSSLPTIYQQVIHKSRYARWNDERRRRETWEETVARYVNFFTIHLREKFDCNIGSMNDPETPAGVAYHTIRTLGAMPSMRALMTAGPALDREHMCGFNCCYRAIDSATAFAELMYILMCGSGVGFSVERQFVGQLPMIPKKLKASQQVINVPDSRTGWAESFAKLLSALYAGTIPSWNTDRVRPAGARLKTMGGYASGPRPLIELFEFTVALFKSAAGDRLNSMQCHDLCCKIGDIVVMGGVRRSALISLSNPSDSRMRTAKSGQWWTITPWRALANNSAIYTERPSVGVFMQEWMALYESKSGERGIVNRKALLKKCSDIARRTHWDDFMESGNPDFGLTDPEDSIEFGVNPCSEIILRSQQTCNLSEIIARPTDTIDELRTKANCAAMLGTWQATLDNYSFVGPDWRKNAAEERLLGVSCTGIMDHPYLANRMCAEFGQAWLGMHDAAWTTNHAWASRLNINRAAAITCVKPSGTVSQLTNTAEGIHSRFAPMYIRRIIMDNHDPMHQFLIDQGIPMEDSITKPGLQSVFLFPIRAPEGAKTTKHRTALQQLEHWSAVNRHWADHSVSCTIQVEEHEWPEVGAWVWNNFDSISGLSFLPKNDSVYQQAPYTACDEDTLRTLEARMPESINWDQLSIYEQSDSTKVGHELACSAAGGCAI